MPSIAPEELLLPDYSDYLHMVAAVIEDEHGKVLLAKRHDHLHQGGLWEFPGGKVESGEERFTALKRELLEELAIEPVDAHPLIRIPYSYPDRKVLLDVWRVNAYRGEPHGAEGQPLVWADKTTLGDFAFPTANRPIISAARLPSSYLITPDPGAESEWPEFLFALRLSLQAGVSLLQFRAPGLDPDSYLKLAQQVVACCREYGARILLNADARLLEQCDADGIHLSSRRLFECHQRPIADEKLLAASCHSLQELRQAEKMGADYAVVSPVQATASHPNAEPLGWHRFHCLSERSAIPLYALGGMGEDDLPDAWHHGAQGIAAIRALWAGGER